MIELSQNKAITMNLEEAYNKITEDEFSAFVYYPNRYIHLIEQNNNPFATKEPIHIVPGSFDPLHDAHRSLFSNALDEVAPRKAAFYELSINRYYKNSLSLDELKNRLKQFRDTEPVIVMYHGLFIHKIGVLRELDPHFHVGFDTAKRICESHGTLGVQGLHAVFYIYPRETDGVVKTIHDLPKKIPSNFIEGFHSDDSFIGLSSTKIRESTSDD